MTATDPDNGDSLFYDILVATIDCTVATEAANLGRDQGGVQSSTAISRDQLRIDRTVHT